MSGVAAAAAPLALPKRRRPIVVLLRRAWRLPRTKVGVLLMLLLVGTALIGPFFAPHDPAAFANIPYGKPGGSTPLGTDALGRDVLSRFLWGGRSILGLSTAATAIGLVLRSEERRVGKECRAVE